MEQFRTELPITPAPFIDHRTTIVTTGSCFSDNIGQKLSESKFVTLVNPLGTSYNPVSIHKSLMLTVPDDELFVESQGLWRNFDFHSKFSDVDKERLRLRLSENLKEKESDVAIITYGTSWVYTYQDKIVSNCHKRPASEFRKRLLTIEEIVNSFKAFHSHFTKKIILTISPVRHLKDTIELNSVSKSVLRHAIHEIVTVFPDVDYFPAFEIMMDDLRDYRFYDKDMIHPSEVAIEYIWEKFGEKYFSEETRELNRRIEKISRAIQHRAFHPSSSQHKAFLQNTIVELRELKNHVDVSKEIRELEQQLNG